MSQRCSVQSRPRHRDTRMSRTVLWRAIAPDLTPDIASRVVWFGSEAVFVSPTGARPPASQAHWTRVPTGGSETWLHLVVDTRGRFGADHPHVRRLYESGRYLIVSVDPEWARTIRNPHYAL